MINAELSQMKNSEQRFASFGTEGTQSQRHISLHLSCMQLTYPTQALFNRRRTRLLAYYMKSREHSSTVLSPTIIKFPRKENEYGIKNPVIPRNLGGYGNFALVGGSRHEKRA